MKKCILLMVLTVAFICPRLSAAEIPLLVENYQEELKKEKKKREKKEKDSIRRGWTFGILPSISYDADLGFQYGALSNIYYFGDGSHYPDYLHSLYFEASYTTKRFGTFRFQYDSRYLIPKHRLTIDISYLPNAMCDFLGFNGSQSVYQPSWSNKEQPAGYISRAYYKHRRDLLRVAADIQGNISRAWKWNAGIGLLGYWVGSVNIDMINKGKKTENLLPKVDGLYEKYRQWNLISPDEAKGGWHPYVRAGITYDTRNRQQNPFKGIYADVFLTYTAAFGKQNEFNNLRFNANFRHYIPVYKDYVSFAYRVAVQLTTAGQSPYYMNSYWNTLFIQRVLYEGLGGGNTLRGVLLNRVVANGFGFANMEFRFKLVKFAIKKEQFYIGLNPFFDLGMVLQPYRIDKNELEASIAANDPAFDLQTLNQFFNFDNPQIYRPHLSAGIGLKVAMNDNFVLSVDWAMPFDKRDNAGWANFYVKIGYMF
ncbi:MAG: BamA/TamA family outer membrane protein [Bacteroidales bacterium]|jgi:outer membrane protein assembly factor BamA|nr:BamA/TamA family outer membrane protein [Bacteroidales bacterium]